MHTVVSSNPPYRLYASRFTPLDVSFVLLSLLVLDKKFASRRSSDPLTNVRRRRYAKDISARSIPPRVIARYEFHVAPARKTTFGRVRYEGETEDEDEDVLRDEAKNSEGRLIRFYNPAAGREPRL